MAPAVADMPPVKRLRTQQACTNCRQIKARCEYPAGNAASSHSSSARSRACRRCATYALDCHTVPRKRPRASRASVSRRDQAEAEDENTPFGPPIDEPDGDTDEYTEYTSFMPAAEDNESVEDAPKSPPAPTTRPAQVSAQTGPADEPQPVSDLPPSSGLRQLLEDRVMGSHFARRDPRLLGPTSFASQLASIAATFPDGPSTFAHNMTYGIRNRDPNSQLDVVSLGLIGASPVWRLPSFRMKRPVVEKLLGLYADQLAPLYPVVLPHSARDGRGLSAFQILAACALASLSRTVPRAVSMEYRSRLHHFLEVVPGGSMWTSNLPNLSAILMISMNSELHGVTTSSAMNTAWLRAGVAARMAQDMGLHRDISDFGITPADAKTRKRLWALTLFMDTWYSSSYGQPPAIDMRAIDAPPVEWGPDAVDQHVFLLDGISRLLRRIDMCYAYGSAQVDNAEAAQLWLDITAWRAHLPPAYDLLTGTADLVFRGLIALLMVSVEYWFIKEHRYPPPRRRHAINPSTESDWQTLVQRSSTVIDWYKDNGRPVVDCWFIGYHCLGTLGFLHYYDYKSAGNKESLASLASLANTRSAWASGQGDIYEATGIRRRANDVMHLLLESAIAGEQAAQVDTAVHTGFGGLGTSGLAHRAENFDFDSLFRYDYELPMAGIGASGHLANFAATGEAGQGGSGGETAVDDWSALLGWMEGEGSVLRLNGAA